MVLLSEVRDLIWGVQGLKDEHFSGVLYNVALYHLKVLTVCFEIGKQKKVLPFN